MAAKSAGVEPPKLLGLQKDLSVLERSMEILQVIIGLDPTFGLGTTSHRNVVMMMMMMMTMMGSSGDAIGLTPLPLAQAVQYWMITQAVLHPSTHWALWRSHPITTLSTSTSPAPRILR